MNETLTTQDDLPAFEELGIPAVRLLQGALYDSDTEAWDILLSRESDLVSYFAKLGMSLVVDRGEGLAYLAQLDDDQRTGGYERLPKLFRRTQLSYSATLLCVLLRDEYRRFEDEDLENERCVVGVDSLLEAWKLFHPSESDEVRLRKQLLASLASLERTKFVRKLDKQGNWEVCKLLKVRLPLEELESLRVRMQEAERGVTSDER